MNETLGIQPVTPGAVRYIKLGEGGQQARACLDEGRVSVRFRDIPHDLCQAGKWEAVRERFHRTVKGASKASDHTRELRDFYTLGEDTLWVTFAEGKLWWAFASAAVEWRDQDELPRTRRAIGGWKSTDISGAPLFTRDLSAVLMTTAHYRSTICDVRSRDYLLGKINAERDPLIAEAEQALSSLEVLTLRLIRRLHPPEFELLIDLIFARAGWRRLSIIGGTQKDLDLLVEQPATGQRAFIQVKASASIAELQNYEQRFRDYGGCDRMFFCCHTPKSGLATASPGKDVDLWLGETIAQKAVEAGLFGWLIERTR